MSTGPANGIIGDDPSTGLPSTKVPEQDLTAERNAAKFSKSKEFQVLKDHLEQRIAWHQTFLPNGTAVVDLSNMSPTEISVKWMAANTVITEFKAVIAAYEQAASAVKEADERTNS